MDDRDLIEAALFVAGRPLTLRELESIVSPDADVEELVESLIAEYREKGALEIVQTNDDVVMQVKAAYADAVRTIAQRDLETPVLRTLAVIAYHQPITQSKVAEIRGNKAYGHIHELEARKLIEATRHGRTRMLCTTKAFADYFGFETESLEEIKERIGLLLR
ncbi:MAG: SMC-Scp complex subunit ScpB [Halobacteriota archaeon]